MAVTTPRETWTDPRIDDLSEKVNDGFAAADKKMETGFAKVDADIRELRGEMKGLRKELLAAAIVIIGVLIKSQGL